MLRALKPAALPSGRNSWLSGAAEMLLGPGYPSIDSQFPILNRPLCCESWVKVHSPCRGGPSKTQLQPGTLPRPFGTQA